MLYTGTFSKVLFPGLRLAYLVVPETQIEKFRDAANHLGGLGSIVSQATVADFMEQGHFARHLRKMRSRYATRRGYLVDALSHTFGSRLHVQPQAGGIHVLAHLNTSQQDKVLADAAQAHGLAVEALSNWRMRRSRQGGLLMGFSGFTTEQQALKSVDQLAAVLKKC